MIPNELLQLEILQLQRLLQTLGWTVQKIETQDGTITATITKTIQTNQQ